MPTPPPPPEEIAALMQFIAKKTKSVTSPMNAKELCKQFKAKRGSSLSIEGLVSRIRLHRLRIHEMNEFDIVTKVKMMFALSVPIDAGFLIEMKEIADVKVDDQQRIIHYKQKDGGLDLSAKYLKLSTSQGEQRDGEIIQFLAEKSKTIDTPIAIKFFLKEFKEKTGCTDSNSSLDKRYRRVTTTIYQSSDIDKNTKIKIMFISNVKLPKDTLKELRKDADVEVDEERRITKYKSKDGSLKLKGNHGMSSVMKSFYSNRWQTIYKKANENESKEDDDEDTNCQKNFEKKRIDLVRFLIERSKNVTSPLSIQQLAKDYRAESKSSEPHTSIESWIQRFRQRIPPTNECDLSTKVKMLFALSATINAKLLKELQKDAIVELDENRRIKKYKGKDGSLKLEGDHSVSAKVKAWAEMKKRIVVNDSSESENDGDEEDGESDGSEEEEGEDEGESVGESTRSKQTPTSSSAKRSDRLRKSRISLQNKNKKRRLSEKSSEATHTQNHARMSRGIKRARISYSSSETSEEEPPEDSSESEEGDDDEEEDSIETDGSDGKGDVNTGDSVKSNQASTSSSVRRSERIRKSTSSTHNNVKKTATTTQKQSTVSRRKKRARISYSSPETSEEEQPKEDDDEESEKSEDDTAMDSETNNMDNGGDDFDQLSYNYYNERDDAEGMGHIPVETKPESLIEIKTEVPEEPSGGESDLIEPKIEECTREVKQEAEEDEEGPSTSSSAKIESMSLLELLNHLRPSIAQYTPALVHRMDEKIKKLEEKDKQIPFNSVLESLEMCIQLLNTLEEMDSDENTTSLPNFFYRLGMAMCTINHSMMNDFYLKIKKLACTAEKKVSLEHIRYVMGKTLDKILH